MKSSEYKELQSVKDKNFTIREIDIIACLIHNRGEKKIAALLSISPRTVSAHVRNIMQKLACNSREGIIDFVEKSGKLNLLKNHYNILLINATFQNYLVKIGKLYNRNAFNIEIISKETIKVDQIPILQELKNHLKLANVNLTISQAMAKSTDKNLNLNLFIDYPSKKIQLIFDKNKELKSIDFRNKTNYYFSVLELLQTIIDRVELKKLNEEFKNDYEAIYHSNVQHTSETEKSQQLAQETAPTMTRYYNVKGLIVLVIGVIIVTLFYLHINDNSTETKTKDISTTTNLEVEQKIDHILKEFSANNTNKEFLQKNQGWIKNVQHIVDNIIFRKMNDSSHSALILPNELNDSLYIIHALASYYLYNEHDGVKARQILEHSKNFAEEYVISRSKAKFNFAQLSDEEIYTELSLIENLPEIYTKIVYLLARTYIYTQDKGFKDQAMRYFALAKYLGNRLGLFEGYLSVRSGIAFIEGDRAITLIGKDNQRAKKKLKEVITLYTQLAEDLNSYIIEYQPFSKTSKSVVPKSDIYNQIECVNQIIKYYGNLIAITPEKLIQQEYLNEIIIQLQGDKNSTGILNQVDHITEKKAASIYIALGNILLICYDQELDFSSLKHSLIKILNLRLGNDLNTIEQVFELANNKSRSTEFTKADSYEGLVQVYKRILRTVINQGQKKELLDKINKLSDKRDKINQLLNRKVNYKNVWSL
ncbi:MAG: helix-turn-helix transcriptional regulator [Rickettsiaceae bacterium]